MTEPGDSFWNFEADRSPTRLPLEGTLWELNALGTEPIIAGTTVTAVFESGSVTGSAGCNGYAAPYAANASHLTFSRGIAATKMQCTEPAGVREQEEQYFALLKAASGYRIEGGRLTITGANGTAMLIYEAVRDPSWAALAGSNWTLRSYRGHFDLWTVALVPGTAITASFGYGWMDGKAGNYYSESYRIDGSSISLAPGYRTDILFTEPAGMMEQEEQYFMLLERVTGYRLREESLVLTDEASRPLLLYTRAE